MTISSKSVPILPKVGLNTLDGLAPSPKKSEAAATHSVPSPDQPIRKHPRGAEAHLRMHTPLSVTIAAYAHAARGTGKSQEKIQADEKEFRLLNVWLAKHHHGSPAVDLTRLLSIPDFLEVDRIVKQYHSKSRFPVPGRETDGARNAVRNLHALVWGPSLVDMHPGISEMQCDALSLLDKWLKEPEPGKPAPGRSLIRLLTESPNFEDLNKQVSLFRNLAEQRWTQNYLTPLFIGSLHALFHREPLTPEVARLVEHQSATATHDFVLKQLGAIADSVTTGPASKQAAGAGVANLREKEGGQRKSELPAALRRLRTIDSPGYRSRGTEPDDVKALDPLKDLPAGLGESVANSELVIADDGTPLR
jgi:hypothetical protein